MAAAGRVYLAVDLGASSGRVLAGQFDGQRVQLTECHRFANGGIVANDRLHWDVLALWQQIKDGMRAAHHRFGGQIASVGVDTWGVDFGLLSPQDELLSNPLHYRDRHTEGYPERAFDQVSRETIFAETGLQFMPFNSLYQLLAMQRSGSTVLNQAAHFLMMPDLFHWLLTGIKSNEFTNATTTQLYNPSRGDWSRVLLDGFQLSGKLFGPLSPPGTSLGIIRRQVAQETGLNGAEVILPGTHDTASAVMAVPASSTAAGAPDWCYLSSGTWSLMGAEVPQPIINETSRRYNFTNEGGVGGTVRLLKNIAGLWLLQECRRVWAQAGQEYSWERLVAEAEAAPLGGAVVDPDHPRFVAPANMPAEICLACRETGQAEPQSIGQVVRCALDSLALRYRCVLDWLEELIGRRIETVHIVGGGVQNRLLCQMTADACDRPVAAGPIEATALGNVMMQAVSCGDVADIAQAREVIARSLAVEHYQPQHPQQWQEPLQRFRQLTGGS